MKTPPPPQRLLGSSLPRLLVVSVGLPALIFTVDRLAIEAATTWHLRALLPVLFVAQVGLLAACAGRYVEHVFLRCVVFTWSLLLVNAVAFTSLFFGRGIESQCMMFALLSGQFGLLTIWGMMNRLPWPVRVPILLTSIFFFVVVMMQNAGSAPWRNETQIWAVILALQAAVVVGVCTILRRVGYRLAPVIRVAGKNEAEALQFSIKDIIFWTTTVALVLVAARSVDWLLMEAQELYWSVILALGMGMVTLVSMFATLSSGRRLMRMLSLLFGAPVIGGLLWWVTSHWTMTWGTTRSSWIFVELRNLGAMWILWSALAAWFLAALLLVFRCSGYQLARRHKTAGAETRMLGPGMIDSA